MVFKYKDKKFYGRGMNVWCERGHLFVEVDKKILEVGNWDEVRDLMSKLEATVTETLLYGKKRQQDRDLVVFPDEGMWTVWYRGKSLDMSKPLVRQLPIMLRFFLKNYHKLMLDYHNGKLEEGFEIETPKQLQRGQHG